MNDTERQRHEWVYFPGFAPQALCIHCDTQVHAGDADNGYCEVNA